MRMILLTLLLVSTGCASTNVVVPPVWDMGIKINMDPNRPNPVDRVEVTFRVNPRG